MRRIPSLISLDATPINYDQVGAYYGHKAAGNDFLIIQRPTAPILDNLRTARSTK